MCKNVNYFVEGYVCVIMANVGVSSVYSKILSKFPQSFSFCFAYGSGVKKQLCNASTNNMIDLVFCVDDPQKWHAANLKDNNAHYSGLKYLGPNFIAKFQDNSGAKVYFNTLVSLDDVLVKYGVVSTGNLITDLLEWSDLYIAGRLHKPVEILRKTTNSELDTSLQLNLKSAVHAALLILPDSFTEYDFYYTISNLSYAGDFRMTFGENKKKVENIVKPQLKSFRNLYTPFVRTLNDYVDFPMYEIVEIKGEMGEQTKKVINFVEECENYVCCQDVSPLAKLHHLSQLPRWPQKSLTRFWNRGNFRQDTEDVLRAIAYDPDCSFVVEQCIKDIVWRSSVRQSLKGILTAGLLKSVKYSSKKIVKMLH